MGARSRNLRACVVHAFQVRLLAKVPGVATPIVETIVRSFARDFDARAPAAFQMETVVGAHRVISRDVALMPVGLALNVIDRHARETVALKVFSNQA